MQVVGVVRGVRTDDLAVAHEEAAEHEVEKTRFRTEFPKPTELVLRGCFGGSFRLLLIPNAQFPFSMVSLSWRRRWPVDARLAHSTRHYFQRGLLARGWEFRRIRVEQCIEVFSFSKSGVEQPALRLGQRLV